MSLKNEPVSAKAIILPVSICMLVTSECLRMSEIK